MAASGEVPLALAFGAGLVATVNPCGFAMLPSLLSYYLGSDSDRRGPARAAEGLVVGLVLTAGFLLVFSSAGVALALGARALVDIVPWLTIAIGAALVALGAWLLAGRHFSLALPGVAVGGGGSYRSMFLFGAAYATGSLSCTLPVFLLVVSSAVATGSALGVVQVFLAYGLGASTILMLLSLGTASFREILLRAVRPLFPHMSRISGVLLLLGGAYVVYYWGSLLGGDRESAAIRLVLDLQQRLQALVLRPGQGVWVATGALLVLAAVLFLALRPRVSRTAERRGAAAEAAVQPSRSDALAEIGERK